MIIYSCTYLTWLTLMKTCGRRRCSYLDWAVNYSLLVVIITTKSTTTSIMLFLSAHASFLLARAPLFCFENPSFCPYMPWLVKIHNWNPSLGTLTNTVCMVNSTIIFFLFCWRKFIESWNTLPWYLAASKWWSRCETWGVGIKIVPDK